MNKLAFLTSFRSLHGTLEIRKELFKSFSKSFKKFYIINSDNLVFLPEFQKLSLNEKNVKVDTKKIKYLNVSLFENTFFIETS